MIHTTNFTDECLKCEAEDKRRDQQALPWGEAIAVLCIGLIIGIMSMLLYFN